MAKQKTVASTASSYIVHDGLSFTADIAGPEGGMPVLLLHGFPQSRYAWRHQLGALANAGLRAYAPDQRGYSGGARPASVESYALEHLVGDALGLMDAVGALKFHLVGHDWGGHIAWMLALRSPERVASLTVLSRPHPAAFAESFKRDAQQAARSGHHASLLAAGVAQQFRQSGFAQFRKWFREQAVPDVAAEHYISTLSEPGAIEAAIDWYRAGASTFRNTAVGRIVVPTLYVWGSADATVGRYAAEATAKFIDAPFRFAEIPGAGHYLTDEVPQQVSTLLLEHLLAQTPPT
jgi:pimeloyl-ACP methyl ester carboxylesterase